jgi:hypothetical protein
VTPALPPSKSATPTPNPAPTPLCVRRGSPPRVRSLASAPCSKSATRPGSDTPLRWRRGQPGVRPTPFPQAEGPGKRSQTSWPPLAGRGVLASVYAPASPQRSFLASTRHRRAARRRRRSPNDAGLVARLLCDSLRRHYLRRILPAFASTI